MVALAGCGLSNGPTGPLHSLDAGASSLLPSLGVSGDWTIIAKDPTFGYDYDIMDSDLVVARILNTDGTYDIEAKMKWGTAHFPTTPGEVPQRVFRLGDALVFGIVNDLDETYRAVAWEPETDEVVTLFENEWTELTLVDSILYYIDRTGPDRSCIRALDLSTPLQPTNDREIQCSDPDAWFYWLVSSGSVVSFLTLPDSDGCSRFYSNATGPEVFTETPIDGCVNRAIGTPAGIVWTDSPYRGDVVDFTSTNLFVTTDASTVSLGKASAGSSYWCGDELFWTAVRTEEIEVVFEAKRWRPGGDVETIYSSPNEELVGDDEYVSGGPECDSSAHVWFQRSAGSIGQQVLTLTASRGQ